MSPKEWPTEEQAKLLAEFLPEYQDVQSKSSGFSDFWAQVNEAWFTKYPEHKSMFPGSTTEEELSEEQRARLGKATEVRRSQLQTWYRWRVNNRVPRSSGKKQAKLIESMISPKTRQYQKAEIYLKIFYEERIRDLETANARPKGLRGKVKCLLVEAEHLVEVEAKAKTEAEKEVPLRTPQQYLDAIREAPSVIGRFFQALSRETGWSFTCIMGGPHPDRGGDVDVVSYHNGKNLNGNTFGLSFPEFDKVCMSPYMDFIKSVYPKSVCNARAMPAKIEDKELLQMDEPENEGEPAPHDASPKPGAEDIPKSKEPLPTSALPTEALPTAGPPGAIAVLGLPPSHITSPLEGTSALGFEGGWLFGNPSSHLLQAGGTNTQVPWSGSDGLGNLNPESLLSHWESNASGGGGYMSNLLNSDGGFGLPLLGMAPQISDQMMWDPASIGAPQVPCSSMTSASPLESAGSSNISVPSPATLAASLKPHYDQVLAPTIASTQPPLLPQILGPGVPPAIGTPPLDALGSTVNSLIPPADTTDTPGSAISASGSPGDVSDAPGSTVNASGSPADTSDAPGSSVNTSGPLVDTTPKTPTDSSCHASETSSTAGGLQQHTSRSGRPLMPSTRMEKLNEIGTDVGKESRLPRPKDSAPTEPPEWMDEAKKYLSGLSLGEDWVSCIEAWVKLETALEYGAKQGSPSGGKNATRRVE
ncbi:hypothetical protein BD779DRAFT_1685291 [Infundibulicybe gibba]|nr:hypothetical protein BD779DRAFT_1685291 [Infundibulicybe gibba]